MKRQILPISAFLLLIVAAWSWWQMRPRVYRTATSPNGTWSVTVLRKRSAPLPLEGVDVIVRVKDAKGRIVFHQTIDNLDIWSDVDDRYSEVICGNDEIKIGPEWWNGKEMAYWGLKKSDLEPAHASDGKNYAE